MLRFFEKYPAVLAVFSEREDGSMKVFPGSDKNQENRRRFFEKIGILDEQVVAAGTVHGTNVEIVNDSREKIILEADGLVTDKKGIFLSVTGADCVSIYALEKEKGIIGLAHAGRRGVVSGIAKNLISKIEELGGEAKNIQIALGPGIGKCHFSVKESDSDTPIFFKDYPNQAERREGEIFVDLRGIIKKQLSNSGVKIENIEDFSECTFENPEKYFSYRRDRPKEVEAMVAVIGMG